MTSFAFILGVVPLVFATGAGAEMRRALGIAVFAGMLGVTLFGLFLTPVFYTVIGDSLDGARRAAATQRRPLCRHPRRATEMRTRNCGSDPVALGQCGVQPAAGCISRPRSRPIAIRRADPAVFAAQPYDPAWWNEFDDPVLVSPDHVRARRPIATCTRRSPGSIRRGRCSTSGGATGSRA